MEEVRYRITPQIEVVCSDTEVDIYQYSLSGDDVDLVTVSHETFQKLVTTVEKHMHAWQDVSGVAN
jgi:hypothetical protein